MVSQKAHDSALKQIRELKLEHVQLKAENDELRKRLSRLENASTSPTSAPIFPVPRLSQLAAKTHFSQQQPLQQNTTINTSE